MDLEILKGLKITDDKEKTTSNQTQVTEQPKQPEHLFDKLSNAFNPAEHKAPPPVAAPPAEPEHQGLFDKIGHAIGGYSDPPKPPSHPIEPKHEGFLTKSSHLFGEKSEAAPPPPPKPNDETLFDKITGTLGGDRHEVAQPPPPPPPAHKNIFEKIGDALSGENDTPPPPLPRPAPKSDGLSDRIQAALHGGVQETEVSQTDHKDKKDILDKLGLGHQPETVPPKEESLLEKIGSTFHHHGEPPKEPTLGEKIGSKLGLGKTEREEDHLDKTIDFVQEHVMHHGDQHNEGRFEQWKDDRIASTIRSQYQHATGHEFPSLKEKK